MYRTKIKQLRVHSLWMSQKEYNQKYILEMMIFQKVGKINDNTLTRTHIRFID